MRDVSGKDVLDLEHLRSASQVRGIESLTIESKAENDIDRAEYQLRIRDKRKDSPDVS